MKNFLTNIPTTRWTAQAIMVAGMLAAILAGSNPARGDHIKVGYPSVTQIACDDRDVMLLGIETPGPKWKEVMLPYFQTGACKVIEDGLAIIPLEELESFSEEDFTYTMWKVEDIKGLVIYSWVRHPTAPEEGI